jgi:hypothetical protein
MQIRTIIEVPVACFLAGLMVGLGPVVDRSLFILIVTLILVELMVFGVMSYSARSDQRTRPVSRRPRLSPRPPNNRRTARLGGLSRSHR